MDLVIAFTLMYLYFGALCFFHLKDDIDTHIDGNDEMSLFFFTVIAIWWIVFFAPDRTHRKRL